MASRKLPGKRMTQSELLEHFAEATGLERGVVKELFEELANLARREVQTKDEFLVPSFGKLVRADRRTRQGRNPATGETIMIPAGVTLRLRVGKGLKDLALGVDQTPDRGRILNLDLGGDRTTGPGR